MEVLQWNRSFKNPHKAKTMENLADVQARYEKRREVSDAEARISEMRKAEIAPNVVVGEVWELEIGKFKVMCAGKKFIKLKRL